MNPRLDPERIANEIIAAGEEWADREAAAKHLEETKNIVRAEQTVACIDASGGMPAAKADAKALASPQYREHIEAMTKARRAANRARVLYEALRLKAEMTRTKEATTRAEMNLR